MVWSMYSRKYCRRYRDQQISKCISTVKFAIYTEFVRHTLAVMPTAVPYVKRRLFERDWVYRGTNRTSAYPCFRFPTCTTFV